MGRRRPGPLQRGWRHIWLGLMYVGASAYPSAEVFAVLGAHHRSEGARSRSTRDGAGDEGTAPFGGEVRLTDEDIRLTDEDIRMLLGPGE